MDTVRFVEYRAGGVSEIHVWHTHLAHEIPIIENFQLTMPSGKNEQDAALLETNGSFQISLAPKLQHVDLYEEETWQLSR